MFGIDRHTKFITNGRLEKIVNGEDLNFRAKEDYDLILVDEAHKYRNHTSQSFGLLQRICKAPRNGDDEDALQVEIDLNITPEIVITETFID